MVDPEGKSSSGDIMYTAGSRDPLLELGERAMERGDVGTVLGVVFLAIYRAAREAFPRTSKKNSEPKYDQVYVDHFANETNKIADSIGKKLADSNII